MDGEEYLGRDRWVICLGEGGKRGGLLEMVFVDGRTEMVCVCAVVVGGWYGMVWYGSESLVTGVWKSLVSYVFVKNFKTSKVWCSGDAVIRLNMSDHPQLVQQHLQQLPNTLHFTSLT